MMCFRREWLGGVLCLGGIFVCFFILSYIFPQQGETIDFIYYQPGFFHTYFHVNGRLGDGFMSIFGGKFTAFSPFFPLVNAVAATAFFVLLFIVFFGRIPFKNRESIYLDCAIFALIFYSIVLFYGGFAGFFIWGAGVFNYLYPYIFILGFLAIVRISLALDSKVIEFQSDKNKKWLKNIGMLILGIIAGWCSELNIVVIVFLAAILLAYRFYFKHKIPSFIVFGFVGFIVGYLILFNSPGIANRISIAREAGSYTDWHKFLAMGFADQFEKVNINFNRVFPIIFFITSSLLFVCRNKKSSLNYFLAIMVCAAVLVSFCVMKFYIVAMILAVIGLFVYCLRMYKTSIDKASKKLFATFLGLYLFEMAFLSIGLQVALPARASIMKNLIDTMLVLCMFLFLLQNVKVKFGADSRIYGRIYSSFIAINIMIAIGAAIFVINEFVHMRYKWEQMIGDINAQKRYTRDIVVSRDYFISSYSGYKDWGNPVEDPNEWPNTTYASHFGCDSFTVK